MNPDALVAGVLAGNRRALSRSITLVESERDDLAQLGQQVLSAVLKETGGAIRVGITGTPGAGKSTLIEALGLRLVDEGRRVAVLAVDPSSPISGGSILGDKTRMERLSQAEAAYIRPSPSGGLLGGVARKTREAMLLCEAAGFDVVLIETVGVGQSETVVAQMVDTFVLLLLPAGGDELQGVKRGVLELSDLVVINKVDGALAAQGEATRLDYQRALHLLRAKTTGWTVPSLAVSAREGLGLDMLWEQICAHRHQLEENGALEARRASQRERWLWTELEHALMMRFREDTAVQQALPGALEGVRGRHISPTQAAADLIATFENSRR